MVDSDHKCFQVTGEKISRSQKLPTDRIEWIRMGETAVVMFNCDGIVLAGSYSTTTELLQNLLKSSSRDHDLQLSKFGGILQVQPLPQMPC